MLDSWWELGEWVGVSGQELDVGSVICLHCGYCGSFEWLFNREKLNQSLHKTLHFVVLECTECVMLSFVMWSANRSTGRSAIHNFVVFPHSLKREPKAPDHWPRQVGSAWEQAHKSIRSKSWDAAAAMAGRGLQAATRHLGAKPGNLAVELDELGTKGLLPKSMVLWAHEIRLLRNVGAHPDPVEIAVKPADATDIVKFLDYFLTYVYNLPKEIAEYKRRRNQKK